MNKELTFKQKQVIGLELFQHLIRENKEEKIRSVKAENIQIESFFNKKGMTDKALKDEIILLMTKTVPFVKFTIKGHQGYYDKIAQEMYDKFIKGKNDYKSIQDVKTKLDSYMNNKGLGFQEAIIVIKKLRDIPKNNKNNKNKQKKKATL